MSWRCGAARSVAYLERHGFEVHGVEGRREHYRRTKRLWRDNLNARRTGAEALAGPEKTGMWLLYHAGCSLASKRTRGPSGLPPSRADLYV